MLLSSHFPQLAVIPDLHVSVLNRISPSQCSFLTLKLSHLCPFRHPFLKSSISPRFSLERWNQKHTQHPNHKRVADLHKGIMQFWFCSGFLSS